MTDDRFDENLSPVFGDVDVCDMVKDNHGDLEPMSNNRSFQLHSLGENLYEIVPKLFKPINIFQNVPPYLVCSTPRRQK